MAHSKLTVNSISGPHDLWFVFEAAATLDARVHGARIGAGEAILDLEPGAPAAQLAARLTERGLRAIVTPGDHLVDVLSARERQLMMLLTDGLQLKEVAGRMGVRPHTAREYWRRVKTKWAVKTLGQAVAVWKEQTHFPDD